MRSLCRSVLILLLAAVLAGSTLSASADGGRNGEPTASRAGSAGIPNAIGGTASSAAADDTVQQPKLPGLRCNPRRTPLKCNIFAKYRGWLAYLKYVGRANPNAKWSIREARYLRNHPRVARRLGPTDIFRHPGKRGFQHEIRTRRDRRHKNIAAAAFAKGGGPNYCSTLTISRKVESSIFRADLFTAYHKTKWCWDDNVVYERDHGNWTEIAVHDGFAIVNKGRIASYSGALPTRSTWYSSQQWSICNCVFHYGAVGHWQPLWQVWARPAGKYDWKAHW
jgi:hypothetical protein